MKTVSVISIKHSPTKQGPERTVKNFAMLIFSLSSEPVTSASAVSLSAGGPTGINIIANQRIGSSERMLVRFARIQIVEMLILGRVSGWLCDCG